MTHILLDTLLFILMHVFLFVKILQCYATMHQCTIDFLNKNSNSVSSPQKKNKLTELNRTWERQRPLIQSRERHLQNLELLPKPSLPAKKPVVSEVVERVQEEPLFAPNESPQNGAVTPRDELTPKTPSPGKRRSEAGGSSTERKSPKSRQRQYDRELEEFSDWLTEQEAVFHSLVADDGIPPNLQALEMRLQQFQVFS